MGRFIGLIADGKANSVYTWLGLDAVIRCLGAVMWQELFLICCWLALPTASQSPPPPPPSGEILLSIITFVNSRFAQIGR